MKNTILLLFSLLALGAVTSCTKQEGQIMVRFQNNLTLDIAGAVMYFDDTHQTTVGDIPAGSTTDYILFDYFQTGDSWPMGLLNGTSEGEAFQASSGLWCGTGVDFRQLEPGHYTLGINQFGQDSTVFYLLKFAE